jgi:hypothetical protein
MENFSTPASPTPTNSPFFFSFMILLNFTHILLINKLPSELPLEAYSKPSSSHPQLPRIPLPQHRDAHYGTTRQHHHAMAGKGHAEGMDPSARGAWRAALGDAPRDTCCGPCRFLRAGSRHCESIPLFFPVIDSGLTSFS